MNQLLHAGQVVATGAMLAERLGCTSTILSDNFKNNEMRYQEGVHYFILKGAGLKEFNLQSENFGLQISSKTRSLYLWTEKGAFNHVKSLGTDEAWEAYQNLVDTYFKVRNLADKLPSVVLPDFTDPIKAAEAWIEQAKLAKSAMEGEKKAMQVVEDLKPHAQIGVNFAAKEGSVSIGTFAPTVGMGQNTLYRRLREDKILISHGDRYNEPYAQYRDWFDVKPGQINEGPKKGMVYFKTKITVVGQMALIKKYGRPLVPNVYGKQMQIGSSY